MKKGMSIREKVLLCILAILAVIMVYYYLFYIPIQEEIARCKDEYILVDDNSLLADAKAKKLAQMKVELENIKSGDSADTKALPAYDNRENLMMQLSVILAKSQNYSINFGKIADDGVTISRSVTLNYTCSSYEAAKGILQEIQNGEYPCSYSNLFLSNEGKTVSVDITYYEYAK